MPEQNNRLMQDLKPTVWIGKQGSSETMIGEIVSQLKKRKLIKVKWLQSTEVDPEAIAAQAKARLVEVRGRTMVLAEKGKAAAAPVPPRSPARDPAKPVRKATAKETARSAVRSQERPPGKSPAKVAGTKAGSPGRRQTGAMKARKK